MPVNERFVWQLRGQRMPRRRQHLGPEPGSRGLRPIATLAAFHDPIEKLKQLIHGIDARTISGSHHEILDSDPEQGRTVGDACQTPGP
ncbi:MAG: hypothetical protein V7646_6894 [Pseudonocardia sp.]